MKTPICSSMIAALALALGAPVTHAQVVSYESGLTDATFGVIDLTPDDGHAAAYTYDLLDSRYFLEIYGPDGLQRIDDGNSGTSPVDYSLSAPNAQIALQTTGVPGEMRVAGLSPGRPGARANAYQTYMFTLAPNSAFTFSAHAQQQVTQLLPDGKGGSWISIVMSNPAGGRTQVFENELMLFNPPAQSFERDIWISYANPTDQVATVEVTFAVGVSMVPEPSTYAMLGIGLLAIGAFARRRANLA